jgi:hypothetical protein
LRAICDQPEETHGRRNIEEALVGAAQADNYSANVDGGSNQ